MKNILILLLFLTSCQLQENQQDSFQDIPENEPISSDIIENGTDSSSQEKIFDIQNLQTQVWIDGLDTPWGLVFLDDTRALVTQRNGNIALIKNGVKQPQIYYKTPSIEIGEGGLMGIEKDNNFLQNKYLYLMYTYYDNRSNLKNKVVRITDFGDTGGAEHTILDDIPGARFHNGGRLKIGPDNTLYITTGDAGQPNLAQDITSLAGKILRIHTDGSIPEDNPFENSLVFSYGHRNPQGLAFETNSGDLFASNHGPTGEFGLRNRDRVLDFIIPGGNYGWPEVTGYSQKYQNPIIYSYDESIPPAGLTFWQNKIFITTLRSQKIIVATIEKEDDTWKLIEQIDFLQNEYGRLRDAVVGLDNNLYILTSNQDGRGDPIYGSDKILKISFK